MVATKATYLLTYPTSPVPPITNLPSLSIPISQNGTSALHTSSQVIRGPKDLHIWIDTFSTKSISADPHDRYPPLILAAGHLSSIIYLIYAVGDSLYTSYKSLGPVSNTRSRIEQRRKFIPVFLGLAITALSVATYYFAQFAVLSYKTWAYEHGLDLTHG